MVCQAKIGTPRLTGVRWGIRERRYSFVTLVLQTCANVSCLPGARTPGSQNQPTLKPNLKYLVSSAYTGHGAESPSPRLFPTKLCAKAAIEFPQSFPQKPPGLILPGRPLDLPSSYRKQGFFHVLPESYRGTNGSRISNRPRTSQQPHGQHE